MENSSKDILLSFIIPVYNVEKYLHECVDSILTQMTEECEIILVNDGSTDSSGEICKSYMEKYPNIFVINKNNGGLSSARNSGLSIAQGKYITFIDSDDRISPNSVEQIINWIKSERADLCFLQITKFYPDGTHKEQGENIVREQLYLKDRECAIRHLTSRPKYPGSACAKLYRRSFLVNNNLHFPDDSRYSEDLGFMLDCIICAQSYDALEMPFYQYRQNRQGSITNSITMKNFMDLFLFIIESEQKLNARNTHVLESRLLMGFVAYEYSIALWHYNYLDSIEKKEAHELLKKYIWVMRYGQSEKSKIINICVRFLGIKISAKLLDIYMSMLRKR